MTDPRNVAHDKRVLQEKKHHGVEPHGQAHHAPQPGKKPALEPDETIVDHGPDSDEPVDKVESGVET
ncbi:MAG: hypothetical protein KAX84_18725 [Burkholderiales bacterium]|nr:hypothetical protein [Burkholderiales bacterium]